MARATNNGLPSAPRSWRPPTAPYGLRSGRYARGNTQSAAGGRATARRLCRQPRRGSDGPAVWVTYAHLQPGSIPVALGDRVTTGQLLGRLGNTGNSTGPHLHFQLADGPDVLTSNSLPFVFDRYTLAGAIDPVAAEAAMTGDGESRLSLVGTPQTPDWHVPAVQRRRRLPLSRGRGETALTGGAGATDRHPLLTAPPDGSVADRPERSRRRGPAAPAAAPPPVFTGGVRLGASCAPG